MPVDRANGASFSHVFAHCPNHAATQPICVCAESRSLTPMARLPRLVFPGVPVHVIQRGNNRTATFHSASDFERYRDTLFQASRRFRCAIHAYVFMPNHVHLLVTPEDDHGPSCMMQAIGRRYVRYVNTRHHRTGTLWEGR